MTGGGTESPHVPLQEGGVRHCSRMIVRRAHDKQARAVGRPRPLSVSGAVETRRLAGHPLERAQQVRKLHPEDELRGRACPQLLQPSSRIGSIMALSAPGWLRR